jgi:hypothetical protein
LNALKLACLHPLSHPTLPRFAGDSKRAGSSSSKGGQATKGKKQPLVQPLGKVPTNKKEEGESIFWAIAVFGFFTTGLLFVTIPAFQVGGRAVRQTRVVVYQAVAELSAPAAPG